MFVLKRTLVAVLLAISITAITSAPASATVYWQNSSQGYINLSRDYAVGTTGCTARVGTWFNAPYAYPGVGGRVFCPPGRDVYIRYELYMNQPSPVLFIDSGWRHFGYVTDTGAGGWVRNECPTWTHTWYPQIEVWVNGYQHPYTIGWKLWGACNR